MLCLRRMGANRTADAEANREAARRRSISPAILYRENAAAKPAFFPRPSTKGAPAPSRGSANSSASNASPYAARRQRRTSPPSLACGHLHVGQIRPHNLAELETPFTISYPVKNWNVWHLRERCPPHLCHQKSNELRPARALAGGPPCYLKLACVGRARNLALY